MVLLHLCVVCDEERHRENNCVRAERRRFHFAILQRAALSHHGHSSLSLPLLIDIIVLVLQRPQ